MTHIVRMHKHEQRRTHIGKTKAACSDDDENGVMKNGIACVIDVSAADAVHYPSLSN